MGGYWALVVQPEAAGFCARCLRSGSLKTLLESGSLFFNMVYVSEEIICFSIHNYFWLKKWE